MIQAFGPIGATYPHSPEDRPVCFSSQEECKKAEPSDLFKSDSCFNHKP
jgi:hypothetical protein